MHPVCSLLAVVLGVAWAGRPVFPPRAAAAAAASTTATSTSSKSSQPLRAPKTTVEQDSKFFSEVTEADPSLESYEQKKGNVALEALLTDGSAFCALLEHGGGIDEALVAEAEGVRGTETQTSLPLSVTTFNAVESVACWRCAPNRSWCRRRCGPSSAASTPICPTSHERPQESPVPTGKTTSFGLGDGSLSCDRLGRGRVSTRHVRDLVTQE